MYGFAEPLLTTHDTFSAHQKYRHHRAKENELMHLIAIDEAEELESLLRKAKWQIGELKHILDQEGIGLMVGESGLFTLAGERDSGNEDDVHSLDGNSNPSKASPTPSSCGQ